MSSISSASAGTNPYLATNQNAFVQFVNDFNAIGNALQSGDVSAAQSALATFQKNLPGGSQQPFGSNSAANTDFNNLSSALQSGNLSGAKQAFANLQTDLEGGGKTHGHHHHHGGGVSDAAASSSSTDSTSDTSDTSDETNSLLNTLA